MNRKTKGFLLAIPLGILFSLALIKRPMKVMDFVDTETASAIAFRTTLADTLGEKTFQKLHIANVEGVKIKYITGNTTSYFEYRADSKTVIKAISELPFPKYASLADTRCRPIPFERVRERKGSITSLEYQNSESFWNVNESNVEVYECLKGDELHTLLIDKKSNRILHRIEFQA